MTGPKGNGEFCFPEVPTVNIKVKGKQNSLFSVEPVFKCLLYLPTQKFKKKTATNCLTQLLDSQICGFKEHDLIMCKSKFKLLFTWGVGEFCLQ